MELLINEYRDRIIDNAIYGSVCIVSGNGKVHLKRGDPQQMTYMRSTEKPLLSQFLIHQGISDHYHLTDLEIAISASAHTSEPAAIFAVTQFLANTGHHPSELIRPGRMPIDFLQTYKNIRENRPLKEKAYNSCIGHHLTLRLLTKNLNADQRGSCEPPYGDLGNPIQKSFQEFLKKLRENGHHHLAYDGCGAPTRAIPLKDLAKLYLQFNQPAVPNDSLSLSASSVRRALHAHPELIDGSNSITHHLLLDENLVAKSGSGGTFCFSLRKENLAVAIKMNGGKSEHLAVLVSSILHELGYQNDILYRGIEKKSKISSMAHSKNTISRSIAFEVT